ncbi:MAG: hypothetical protein P4M08_10210 [Oligoflexia bacterium]|nr:hypothetical protein [Oligoflexia bacterium]
MSASPGLSVDFQLEILEECGFHCQACYVDKTARLEFGDNQIRKMHALFSEFQAKSYDLDHLIVGPTDFTTSPSFDRISEEKHFGELTSFFNATNWTTTLLARNWQEKVEKLSRFNRSREATFSIVLNPQKSLDRRYLDLFVERCRQLREIYAKPIRRFYIVFNAYPHRAQERVDFKRDYLTVHRLVHELFKVPSFEHGFSFTRAPSIQGHKERIMGSMDWLNQVYDEVADATEIPIQFLIEGDYSANRYVFKNDRFYFAPLWHEPFVNFDPALEVPVREWSVSEFERFEQKIVLRQYERLDQLVCGQCTYNPLCLKRGIVHLLDVLGENRCLVPRQAVEQRGLAYD